MNYCETIKEIMKYSSSISKKEFLDITEQIAALLVAVNEERKNFFKEYYDVFLLKKCNERYDATLININTKKQSMIQVKNLKETISKKDVEYISNQSDFYEKVYIVSYNSDIAKNSISKDNVEFYNIYELANTLDYFKDESKAYLALDDIFEYILKKCKEKTGITSFMVNKIKARNQLKRTNY